MDEETGDVGTLMGDMNLDGTVNAVDLVMLKANFGAGSGYAGGDLNADGVVDLTDLMMLKANFGASIPGVPEPMTFSLVGLGAVALLRRKRS